MTAKLTRFIIRESLREIQEKTRFSSLEDLVEAVTADLESEGYAIDEPEREKIRQLVEEEGYTGRFAFDDVLRRKFRGKRLWPVASVALALIAFLVTTVAGALIEHFVQAPLEGGGTGQSISAVFSVPDQIDQNLLKFSVRVRNVSDRPLKDLVVFASAGEAIRQLTIEKLDVNDEQLLEGTLDVAGVRGDPFAFTTYIVGSGFSFRSEPVRVSRTEPTAVAMVHTSGVAMVDTSRVESSLGTRQAASAPPAPSAPAPVGEMAFAGAAEVEERFAADKTVAQKPMPGRDLRRAAAMEESAIPSDREVAFAEPRAALKKEAAEDKPSAAPVGRTRANEDMDTSLQAEAPEEMDPSVKDEVAREAAMVPLDSDQEVTRLLEKVKSGEAGPLETNLLEAYARRGNTEAQDFLNQ